MGRYSVTPRLKVSSEGIIIGDSEKGALKLGTLAEGRSGITVGLDFTKEHVIAIVGKRGSGKSYTLGKIIEGLSNSSGEFNSNPENSPASICFDLMDIYWTSKYKLKPEMTGAPGEQYKLCENKNIPMDGKFDVDLYVPAGFETNDDPDGINLFTLPIEYFEIDDWQHLLEVDPNGPTGALVAESLYYVANGWLDGDDSGIPAKEISLDNMIDFIENSQIADTNYQSGTRRAVIQRMNSWRNNDLVKDSHFDVRNLLKTGKSSIIMLGRLAENIRFVVISILTRLIMKIRRQDSFLSKRAMVESEYTVEEQSSRCWILCDETQLVAPRGRSNHAKKNFIRLVKEGRNFGTSFIFATQQPSAVDEELLSQTDVIISHQLAMERDINDIRRYSKGRKMETMKAGKIEFDYPQLMRALNPGQAIVSFISKFRDSREIIVDVDPRARVHGGFEV